MTSNVSSYTEHICQVLHFVATDSVAQTGIGEIQKSAKAKITIKWAKDNEDEN